MAISNSIHFLIYEEYAGQLHGNQRYICLLAEKLRSSLDVLLPFRAELAINLGSKVSLNILPSLHLLKRPFAIARHMRKNRPDVLLVNNERSFLIATMGALLSGVPVIWYVKNFRSSLLVDFICFLLASRVLTIAPQCIERKGIVARLFSRKVYHLPIGIPLEHFLSIPEANIQREKLQVLMLSSITPSKGIQTAVDAVRLAMEKGVSLKLRIAGATPATHEKFAEEMQQKTTSLPIEWLGWQADVPSLIQDADVVILPSFSEGVPRSLVESMAAARPVIASRIGGIPSIVDHGRNGLLVSSGNAEDLALALTKIDNNPEMRCKMGHAARVYAIKHHDLSRHLELLKTHLEKLARV